MASNNSCPKNYHFGQVAKDASMDNLTVTDLSVSRLSLICRRIGLAKQEIMQEITQEIMQEIEAEKEYGYLFQPINIEVILIGTTFVTFAGPGTSGTFDPERNSSHFQKVADGTLQYTGNGGLFSIQYTSSANFFGPVNDYFVRLFPDVTYEALVNPSGATSIVEHINTQAVVRLETGDTIKCELPYGNAGGSVQLYNYALFVNKIGD